MRWMLFERNLVLGKILLSTVDSKKNKVHECSRKFRNNASKLLDLIRNGKENQRD